MAVMRVHKTKDYTVMSNAHFREKGMSLKAKGLLSLMLSLPDDWDYSIAGLVTLSKDGKDSVMNALNELEDFGYLKRTKVLNDKGQFAGVDYDIYEQPKKAAEKPEAEAPEEEENPNAENPNAVKPNSGKPLQLNTNSLNTKVSNTYIYKYVVQYLNDLSSSNYRPTTKKTQDLINARLNEGFTLEDFKTVIEKKCADWTGTKFEQFIRPITLFGNKFESYLNEPVNKKGATGIAVTGEIMDEEVRKIFGE